MKKEELEKKVKNLSKEEWNHYYEFPYGVKTRRKHIPSPGYCIYKWPRLLEIFKKEDLKGKTLVDVGCSDGYFSINAASLGLTATGFDLDPLRIKRANFAKDILQQENVEFYCGDVFQVDGFKKFDYCLAAGLLHRVGDAAKCMSSLSKLSDILILEYKTYESDLDVCYQGKKGETKTNLYNTLYEIPTNTFVNNRLEELGFSTIQFKLDTKSSLRFKRTVCVARR